jgi:hypothetical protein
MKSGPRVVIRYSSTHEKTLPNRSLRCRMELHRTLHARPKGHGRPRTHSLREILNAVFYLLKSGCQWRLLPHDFPRDGPPATITSENGVSTVPGSGSTVLYASVCGFARGEIHSPARTWWIASR